jgi:penicillin-binding protein 2
MRGYNGSIVALDPNSGEILCMVTSPNYNPSDMISENRNIAYPILENNEKKPLLDRSISSAYPPGSTLKMLTALMALEENIISVDTIINCNYGWRHPNKHVLCHGIDHEPLNITNAIAQSCNAYFSEVFHQIIHKKSTEEGLTMWEKYVRNFGFGDYLNNDLYTGVPGNVPNTNFYNKMYNHKWTSTYIISLAIGQGEMSATPIQLANYTSIIANKGYFFTPHIIKKICTEQTEKPFVKCDEWEQINTNLTEKKTVPISVNYFDYIIEGMERVLNGKKGTAAQALVKNITICGKTGTVENNQGEDHSVFIAFAPKENPKVAICVYIENGGYGGSTAAPIASLCIEQYLNGSIDTSFVHRPNFNKQLKQKTIEKLNARLYD